MDDEEVSLGTIIEQYSETDPAQIDLEEDPEPEAMPPVSTDEAIDMLEGLCLYEFQQEDGAMEIITQVEEGQYGYAEGAGGLLALGGLKRGFPWG